MRLNTIAKTRGPALVAAPYQHAVGQTGRPVKTNPPMSEADADSALQLEDALASAILAIGKIEEHLGPRGPYFTVGSRTIAYTAAPGVVEVWLPSPVVEELRSALQLHPNVVLRRKGSRWVGVRVTKLADVQLVSSLAMRAAAAVRTVN